MSYSPVELAVAGRPILDLVDESVGTFALPISALLLTLVFVWATDLDSVHDELGVLYPLVRYVTPAVLVVVTTAKAAGIARPTWRLLVDAARIGSVAKVVAGVVFVGLLAVGWLYRNRIPDPRRSRSR